MNNKVLKTLTLLMLITTLLLLALFGLILIYSAIIIKVIYPIIIFSLFFALFLMFSFHYLKCYLHIIGRKIIDSKRSAKTKRANHILAALWGVIFAVMIVILLVTTLILRAYFDFQWYFLFVAIISSLYSINLSLISKSIS
jgi:hypothetical protein